MPPHNPVQVTVAQGSSEVAVDERPRSEGPSLRHLKRLTDVECELFSQALVLYKTNFTASYELPVEDLKEYIRQGKYLMLVHSDDNEIVQALAVIGDLEPYGRSYCLLDYFVVDPRFRGNGYGAKFFKVILEYLHQETQFRTMLLECDNGLMGWYSRLGAKRCNIPSSLCLENANDDITSLESFNLMAVSVTSDTNDEVARIEADPERIRRVIVHMRTYLHDLFHMEERLCEKNGTVNSYLVWW